MQVSFLTKALIAALGKKTPSYADAAGDRIIISRTVSAMALLYEKVRVAIEYREDHLLRRAAIERMLKRLLILNDNGRGIAGNLLKELLWAKYLPDDSLPVGLTHIIQVTIDKYIFLRNEIAAGRGGHEKRVITEWLISSAAAEIEEKLVPNPEREAFINFVYRYFQNKIFIKDVDDKFRDIQTYIGVHRAFARSDNDFIRYSMLKLLLPEMPSYSWKDVQERTKDIYQVLQTADEHIANPIGPTISRQLKKEIAPFLILRDLYEQDSKEFVNILEDEARLNDRVESLCRKRYEEIGRKLRRAATRSIIYIFLTKMVFAFALEYPFDRYVLKDFKPVPLAVNTLVPPFLMFLSILGLSPPGEDNTKRIIERMREIVYDTSKADQRITLALKTPIRHPLLIFFFSVFYLIAFFMVFGSIVVILSYFHFTIASQAIFIFFVTVVVFFAYRIRQTGKEYMIKEREGLLSPLVHFFLLPVLNVGKWLSSEIAKINFFVALFDFVFEAPFKAIFGLFEEWFAFIRRKKDEIV